MVKIPKLVAQWSVFFQILKFPKFLFSIRKRGQSSPKNCLRDKKLSAVTLQIYTQNVCGLTINMWGKQTIILWGIYKSVSK